MRLPHYFPWKWLAKCVQCDLGNSCASLLDLTFVAAILVPLAITVILLFFFLVQDAKPRERMGPAVFEDENRSAVRICATLTSFPFPGALLSCFSLIIGVSIVSPLLCITLKV